MFPVFDIAIDKLRIQAAKKEAAMIATDLQNGGWHTGEHRQWVFIRQLAVSSPKNGLRLNTSRHIRYELERAVHGASQNAHNANAVRFFSMADMLTFLVRDLAEGRTRSWYWEKWSHLFYLSKSEAITQLLWDNISEVAEVFQKLASIGALQNVWQQLSLPHAEILLARLASAQNISPQALAPSPEMDAFALQKGADDLQDIFKFSESTISVWRGLLTPRPAFDAKFYFAAALTSVALAPQAMAQRPQQVIAAFYRSLTQASAPANQSKNSTTRSDTQSQSVTDLSFPSPQPGSMQDQTAAKENRSANKNTSTLKKAQKENVSDSFTPEEARSRAENALKEGIGRGLPHSGKEQSVKHTSPKQASPERHAVSNHFAQQENAPDKPASEEREDYQFYTRFGGIFYLINAINHPDSYALLRQEKEWEDMLSGWTLVYSLANKLEADLDQSLLRFFAEVAGLPSVGELRNYQHPELVKRLLPLFQQRYASKLNFDCSLLHIPARVSVSYSHVSVDYDMQSIRLPVRLCGLDVDPGWIPWLGRVVRFHYRSDAILRAGDDHE